LPVSQGLRVEQLVVRYPRTHRPAIAGLSFSIPPSQTLAVVGPSGAGKTTLLRALAGLIRTESGDILADGRSVRTRPPQERRMALVFAEDALLPHRSVQGNLAFVAPERQRVAEIARALEISGLRERHPSALSTGERRRVSLARALLVRPFALLLDEPLAALDPELRALVREELLHVRERFDGPMLLVTHDHADAMTFAQTLAVLVDGRLEDIGDPQRVYDRPSSVRAASFLGARPMNILPGEAFGERPGVLVGVRPERVRLASDVALRGRLTRIERTGADSYASVETPHGFLVVRLDAREDVRNDTTVAIGFDASDLRRFDERSGAAIA
jgi:ABC-type sugar transport system ATPase subunit